MVDLEWNLLWEGDTLEMGESFCYLGDMILASGGCERANGWSLAFAPCLGVNNFEVIPSKFLGIYRAHQNFQKDL